MNLFDKLYPHIGHNLTVAVYGDREVPDDICVECLDCNEVLVSAETERMSCSLSNDNLVWVTPAVYERFENNPKKVFIEAQGKPLMRLKVTGVGK